MRFCKYDFIDVLQRKKRLGLVPLPFEKRHKTPTTHSVKLSRTFQACVMVQVLADVVFAVLGVYSIGVHCWWLIAFEKQPEVALRRTYLV